MPYDIKKALIAAKIQIPESFTVTENIKKAIQLLADTGILDQENFDLICLGNAHNLALCLMHLKVSTEEYKEYFRQHSQNAGRIAHFLESLNELLTDRSTINSLIQTFVSTLLQSNLDVTQINTIGHIFFTYLDPTAQTPANFNLLCSNHAHITDIHDAMKKQIACEAQRYPNIEKKDTIMFHQLTKRFTPEQFSKLIEDVLTESSSSLKPS